MSELPDSLPSPRKATRPSPVARAFAALGSFSIAVVVLAFLLLLTWLGTISQVDTSLYDVQKKYFDSWFLLQEVGPLKVPLPGAFLLMSILFVNMLVGGILRIRKNWRTFGVVISHCSILVLLVAGAVSFYFKREGHLKLHEGQAGNVFTSYHDRVIEITEVGKDSPVLLIHESQFSDLGDGRTRTFHAPSLPFDLVVTQYAKNAEAESAAMRPPPAGTTVADGFYLRPQQPAMSAEANLAGVIASVREPGAPEKSILLWEVATAPVTHRTADGRIFTIHFKRQSWELPFTVTLNQFTHEKHPGTMRPKVFASDVIKRDSGVDQPVKIEMNKPLRHEGYTLFQASYNEKWTPDRPRSEMFSVFAVVNNPSDQWPVWATIMAAVGMTLHFCMKLAESITRSSRARAAAATAAAAKPSAA
jgi:hypothetical protein